MERRMEEAKREEKKERLFSVQNAVHDCEDIARQRAGTKCLKSTGGCQSLCLLNCRAALFQERLWVYVCESVRTSSFLIYTDEGRCIHMALKKECYGQGSRAKCI